jgi:hypothetical protein
MAITATKDGGLIECEGAPVDDAMGKPAIRALRWHAIEEIRAQFDPLNPYDRRVIPSILNIEDINYRDGEQREIWAYVVSAKRYALFGRNGDGTIALLKGSEHGLGHLLSPMPRGSPGKWPDILWELILAEELGLPHETPAWLECPAVSRVSVSSPAYFRGFLRRYSDLPYRTRIKPFGFLLSAQVARFSHPEGTDPTAFHLVAPYSASPRTWASQLWTDVYSGAEYGITTALSYLPGITRVKSLADVKAEFLAHGEVKSAAANGEPAEASSRGLLQRRHVSPSIIRLMGKESNCFEAVEAGLLSDWSAVLSDYEGVKNGPSPELLESASAATIARAWNVSTRTVRAWRRRRRERAKPD